jgi:pimeloyl-ACP methyl ester carboxylesterase
MNLNFKSFGTGFPVVILHGLLGSLDNWQTIAKKLDEYNFQVFIVDQRNHGKSPHTDKFSYDLLCSDLLSFFEQNDIIQAHIIGHSMGGKVAMKFALEHPERVNKLVVVDIAPSGYDDKHSYIFEALYKANATEAKSREEVLTSLRNSLGNDETTVQFLMKNLQRSVQNPIAFEWKFNLDSLTRNYSEVATAINCETPFTGKALFIKGEKSNYLNSSNFSSIANLFPNNYLIEIANAGHWVHAENPTEFLIEVHNFLST